MLRRPAHEQIIAVNTDCQAYQFVHLRLHTPPISPGDPCTWRVSVSSLGLVPVRRPILPLWLSQHTDGNSDHTRVFGVDTVDPDHTYPDWVVAGCPMFIVSQGVDWMIYHSKSLAAPLMWETQRM